MSGVALVIAQPLLSMMIREVLNQSGDAVVHLATDSIAELAALERREVVQVVICEPLSAQEIRSLLFPDQRLVILTRGGMTEAARGDLVLDLAAPGWPSVLTAFVRSPRTSGAVVAERRQHEAPGDPHQLVTWLHQRSASAVAPSEVMGSSDCQNALQILPQLGQPTALIFLSLQRVVHQGGDASVLFDTLKIALRGDDALFRLDDRTVAILAPIADPRVVSCLLTRLTWQLWPSDPTALSAGHAVWTPGLAVEKATAAAWSSLQTALNNRVA